MEQGNHIFENCTLLQACEWIAYKIPPMETIRAEAQGFKRQHLIPSRDTTHPEMIAFFKRTLQTTSADEEYSQKIYDAAAKLKLEMYDKNIKVYGDISEYETTQKLLNATKTGKSTSFSTQQTSAPHIVQITDIPTSVKLDITNNTIIANDIMYKKVYIPFKDLQHTFHNPYASAAFDSIKTRYRTPYMETMAEVINELKISTANQPPKKVLQDIISQKLDARGIVSVGGKPPATLVSYMATIIRLPESQKGHA